jgi:hypothetical protein
MAAKTVYALTSFVTAVGKDGGRARASRGQEFRSTAKVVKDHPHLFTDDPVAAGVAPPASARPSDTPETEPAAKPARKTAKGSETPDGSSEG